VNPIEIKNLSFRGWPGQDRQGHKKHIVTNKKRKKHKVTDKKTQETQSYTQKN